ncbi:hypothetical protein E2C01_032705 [Portunus trituberculatus]|uniref:Uncharacterized protein n=1 Tax=Portunus trituberculatus TaxID=210409 RepID=A0A5B7EVY4_PORTR|nr:hypothetical protein [Portunus trituberculatus]
MLIVHRERYLSKNNALLCFLNDQTNGNNFQSNKCPNPLRLASPRYTKGLAGDPVDLQHHNRTVVEIR